MSLASVCSEQLFSGSCATAGCALQHDFQYCAVCAVICAPSKNLVSHNAGKQHRTNLASSARATGVRRLRCPACNVQVMGDEGWLPHISLESHRNKTRGSGEAVYPRDALIKGANRCFLCCLSIPKGQWGSHLDSRRHLGQQQASLYRARFEQAEEDRGGVVVSHGDGVDFGVVELGDAKRGICQELVVGNADRLSTLFVVQAAVYPKKQACFSVSVPGNGRLQVKGHPERLAVTLKQTTRGRVEGRIEVTLQRGDHPPFLIIRKVSAVIGNAADHTLLKPTAPYMRRQRLEWHPDVRIFPGDRPPAFDGVFWARKLSPYTIPALLKQILGKRPEEEQLSQIKAQWLSKGLEDPESHTSYFHVLLWIEEDRATKDIQEYDMTDVVFGQEGRLHTLVVPGLAEKRPSVAVGDTIMVQHVGPSSGRTQQGYVHDVRQTNIRVSFHKTFDGTAGRFKVRFSYNRTTVKRQHQALEFQSESSHRLLFPTPQHAGLARAIRAGEHPITPFNPLVATNARQLQAVKTILNLRIGAGPLILFGPPGTGKTVTVVEAIRQILAKDPNARILACAPSNSAADIIAQRLTMLSPTELFRCYAATRNPNEAPKDLVPYTLFGRTHYGIPPIETLCTYKVIVSTCGNASFAYNLEMPPDHFTHIFVDEAGQASEPEALNAIKTTTAKNTRVILAGDPKQLGPVIRSSLARELGLGVSFLERLMERDVYKGPNAHGSSYIKLVKNFRSHRAIIDYPNAKFYDGELEVCGDPASINSFIGSPQLATRKFPVVFHAISGENQREASSPSYFNIDEATEVKEYVLALLKDRTHPVEAKDIGVITPYRAQARKIRMLLKEAQVEDAKVASTEEFQGEERRVIIVSTVRSSRELLQFDAKFTLGFVANPRRFNVAMTRAKALLIVVGDPNVLSIDPLWRGFMNYVFNHGGWRGAPMMWDPTVPVRDDVDYAEEIREAGAAELHDFVARLDEHGNGDLEAEVNDAEGPFQERD